MSSKQTFTVYGDTQIDFYPNSHRYKKAGEKNYLISVTSATGVIDKSQVLMGWATRLGADHLRDWVMNNDLEEMKLLEVIAEAQNLHQVKKEEAATFGSLVHDFAEQFANYKLGKAEKPVIAPDYPVQVINGINAFLGWLTDNHVEFMEAERLIYSKQHDYVGLTDLVAKVNGVVTLVDYKTGSGIYSEHLLQVSAYKAAYNEEMEATKTKDLHASQTIILHFNKATGDFSSQTILPEEEQNLGYLEAFLSALSLKKQLKVLSKY